jgi:hypothetical protein
MRVEWARGRNGIDCCGRSSFMGARRLFNVEQLGTEQTKRTDGNRDVVKQMRGNRRHLVKWKLVV